MLLKACGSKSQSKIYGIPRVLERDKNFHTTVHRDYDHIFNHGTLKFFEFSRGRLVCIPRKILCASALFNSGACRHEENELGE